MDLYLPYSNYVVDYIMRWIKPQPTFTKINTDGLVFLNGWGVVYLENLKVISYLLIIQLLLDVQ